MNLLRAESIQRSALGSLWQNRFSMYQRGYLSDYLQILKSVKEFLSLLAIFLPQHYLKCVKAALCGWPGLEPARRLAIVSRYSPPQKTLSEISRTI